MTTVDGMGLSIKSTGFGAMKLDHDAFYVREDEKVLKKSVLYGLRSRHTQTLFLSPQRQT